MSDKPTSRERARQALGMLPSMVIHTGVASIIEDVVTAAIEAHSAALQARLDAEQKFRAEAGLLDWKNEIMDTYIRAGLRVCRCGHPDGYHNEGVGACAWVDDQSDKTCACSTFWNGRSLSENLAGTEAYIHDLAQRLAISHDREGELQQQIAHRQRLHDSDEQDAALRILVVARPDESTNAAVRRHRLEVAERAYREGFMSDSPDYVRAWELSDIRRALVYGRT